MGYKEEKLIENSNFWLFKIAIWSILLIFLATLYSCGTPSTVRSLSYNKKVIHNEDAETANEINTTYGDKKNKDSEVAKNEILSQIEKFENNIQDYKDEDEASQPKVITGENIIKPDNINLSERKIPTLREQMAVFSKKQNEIDDKVNSLNAEIQDIKKTLSRIENKINSSEKQIIPVKKEQDIIYPDRVEKPKKDVKEKAVEETFIAKEENPKTNKVTKKNNVNLKPEYESALNDFNNEKYNEAIKVFKEIASKTNDKILKSKSNYYIAKSYQKVNNHKEAVSYFNKVVDSPNESINQAELISELAESNLKAGKIEDAKRTYKNIIEKYPESPYVPIAMKMLQQL